MTTKAQIRDAILEANPQATGLDKLNKADLELALAALQAQPEPGTDEGEPKRVMGALREARKGYVTLTRNDGGKSLGCGDDIQRTLRAYGPADLQALAALADDLIGPCPANKAKPEQPHGVRYAHLNNGQIRMNIGNRLRGAIKRGALKIADNGTLVAV